MELEEEIYVRIIDGGIMRLKVNNKYDYLKFDVFNLVKKTSSNIIELIEEGDYVNGVQVDSISHINGGFLTFFTFDGEEEMVLSNEDIYSIVTKEQFESVAYNIKE